MRFLGLALVQNPARPLCLSFDSSSISALSYIWDDASMHNVKTVFAASLDTEATMSLENISHYDSTQKYNNVEQDRPEGLHESEELSQQGKRCIDLPSNTTQKMFQSLQLEDQLQDSATTGLGGYEETSMPQGGCDSVDGRERADLQPLPSRTATMPHAMAQQLDPVSRPSYEEEALAQTSSIIPRDNNLHLWRKPPPN